MRSVSSHARPGMAGTRPRSAGALAAWAWCAPLPCAAHLAPCACERSPSARRGTVQAGASGARLAVLRDVVEHSDRLPARDDLQRRLGAHEAEAALRGRARSWPPSRRLTGTACPPSTTMQRGC